MRPEREPGQLGWFAPRTPLVESKLPAPRRAGPRAARRAPAPTTCPEVGRACDCLPNPAHPSSRRACPVLLGRRLVCPFLNRRACRRPSARLQRAPSRDAYATYRRTSARHRFLQCSRFSHAGEVCADTLRQLRRQAPRPAPGFSGLPGRPRPPTHRADPALSRRRLPRPTGA